jgi:hypothetical protein
MWGKPVHHHPFAGIPFADEKEYLQKQAEFLSGRLQALQEPAGFFVSVKLL